MTDEGDALRYFDLQGSTEVVTKTELARFVRSRGQRISDRNITYYSSVGLIPSAVRVGSRGGAYPKIVRELLLWVVRSRAYGLSIDAIKELVPLWELLVHGRRKGCIDLAEVERVARDNVARLEANRVVPLLLGDLIADLCDTCRQQVLWILKDGTTASSTRHDPLTLGFVLAEVDPATGWGRPVAWTQLQLPGIGDADDDRARTIVLGIPNGVPMIDGAGSPADRAECRSGHDLAECLT